MLGRKGLIRKKNFSRHRPVLSSFRRTIFAFVLALLYLLPSNGPTLPLAQGREELSQAEGQSGETFSPLSDASIQIVRTRGNVTLDTKAIIPPHKLETGQFLRTGEDGMAIVDLLINQQSYAMAFLSPGSELAFDHCSPTLVRIYLEQGKTRFRSDGGGLFEITLGEEKDHRYTFNPLARVADLRMDFVVETDTDGIKIFSLRGGVLVEGVGSQNKVIDSGKGLLLKSGGEFQNLPFPEQAWWDQSFYQLPGRGSGPLSFLESVAPWVVFLVLGAILLFFIFLLRCRPAALTLVVIVILALAAAYYFFWVFPAPAP